MKRSIRAIGLASVLGALLAGAATPVAAATGPQMVKNINTGGSSDPRYLTTFNGKAYFSATDGAKGRELWTSDGTAAGTQRVKDIRPGSKGSFPRGLTVAGGLLFFAAADGVHGFELWVTDGSAAGTQRLSDINPGAGGSVGEDLIRVGNLLYFFAYDSAAGRRELWTSDGTTSGTHFVKQFFQGAILDGGEVGFKGKLYFALDQCGGDVCAGLGLWVSNGTAAGTFQFFSSDEEDVASYPNELAASGGFLYWNDDGTLYRTKGTASSTKSLGSLNPSGLTNVDGTLFFGRTDALWKSNGTVAGTVLVEALPSTPFFPTAAGDHLFFVTWQGDEKTLWSTDGTHGGLEAHVIVGHPARLDSFTNVNGILYYISNGGLARSDGTPGGSYGVVLDGMGEAEQLTNVGGTLFFTNAGNAGRELWRYVP